MKKLFFLAVMATVVLTSFRSMELTPEFKRTYQEVLRLNQGRFNNVDSIQVGDGVLFPAQIAGGRPRTFYARFPENGRHDCIYRLVASYMAGELPTKVEPLEKAEVPSFNFWSWLKLNYLPIFLGLIILLLIIMLIIIISALRVVRYEWWYYHLRREPQPQPQPQPRLNQHVSPQELRDIIGTISGVGQISHLEYGDLEVDFVRGAPPVSGRATDAGDNL